MRITPNCHHLKFNVGKAARNYVGILKFLTMNLIFLSQISVFPPWSKHPCKEQREGRTEGWYSRKTLHPLLSNISIIPSAAFPPLAMSSQVQCLKHLKTGLSWPMKCTGFNVCRSTKALSSEHLTYWQAMWKGNVFLQVASYFGSSKESISIAVSHTDRAPCCLYSPRYCKSSVLTAFYTKIIIPINLNCVGKFKL